VAYNFSGPYTSYKKELAPSRWSNCLLGRVTIAQQSRDQTSQTLEAN